MANILDINPSDFGFKPTSPTLSPSNITKSVESGNLGVSIPNPLDDQDLFRKPLETGEISLPSPTAPSTQYFDAEKLKRYNGSAEYTPTMNPLADNEKIMADNWSKWDAVKTGLSGMLDNGLAAYSEYGNFWPRLGRAIYNLDSQYLKPNEAELQTIGEEARLVGVNNPIYYPEGVGQHDIFTRQFLASSLQNVGFTLGTMAGFATEAVVFKKFGNLSKLFQGSAAAKSTVVASELGQTNRVLTLGTKEKALRETAEQMVTNGATSRLGQKSLYDQFLKYATYVPVVGTLAETGQVIRQANAARAAMGAAAFTEAEISRIGRGGLARAFQEWNFAASEASIEAGTTYADIYEDAIASFKEKNDNQDPSEDIKQDFRSKALEGSTADYGSNIAVLAIMNKMAFGNMFRKFGIDGKFLNMVNKESGKFYALTKGAGKDAFYKVYKRKFLGAISDAKDISKFFGKTALAKEVGKDISRNLLKFEVIEGLQENIQEGINFGLRKHYKDLYDGKVSTWGEDFKAAVDDQMSKKGWATFLQGAMTGLFVGPISGTMTAVSERLQETKEHRAQLEKVLNSLNETGKNPNAILKEPIKNIKLQAAFNNGMTQAAQTGLKYEYFNNRSSAIITQALYAKRTGTFDAFKTFLNSYGTEFDAKEFEEATGINVQEFGASSPAEFMADLTGKLDRYGELYEKYNNQFGQYFTIDTFENDPRAKEKYSFSVAALQDAIHNIAFNEAKAEDGVIRAGEIARTISEKNKSIGNAATSTFTNITEHQAAEVQISILNNEIKTLEEAEGVKSKETLDLIELKKQELELLKQWNETAYKKETQTIEDQEVDTFNPLDFNTLESEQQAKLVDILAKYYEVKNKQTNVKTPVALEEVKAVLQDINDYQKLGRDTKDYMSAVNLLSDPKNALKAMHSFEDARVGAFARLMHDKYTELAKMSGIFEEYINNNPKDMEELLNIARSPFTSIATSKKLYEHLDNLNKMVDDHNKKEETEADARRQKAEEALQETINNLQKDAFNLLAAAPRNIRMMTEEEAIEFLSNHYEATQDKDDNFLGELQRVYVDADGNKQISHLIPDEQIENFFKDKEGFNLFNISTDDLFLFIENFEQDLYDKENGVTEAPESTQEHQVIANEVKKLKNLVDEQVIYQGRKGTLKRNEKGFYIEFGAEESVSNDDAIERRRELTTFTSTRTFIRGVKYEVVITKKFGMEGYYVDVSNKADTVTGFIYNTALSEHFDTIEEAIEYANQIIQGDKEYIKKLNTELGVLNQPTTLDVIEIGEDNSYGSTSYVWETNEQTGRLEMVDKSEDLTLDDIAGLELIEDGLTEEKQTITGVNSNSQTIGNHTIEYVSENTYRIDAREYIINEDEDGNFLGITYTDEDGNGVFLTDEDAQQNPNSLTARLVNVAKIIRLQNGVNVTQETLDEANKVLGSITPAGTVRITTRSKGQVTKNLVNSMVDTMPDDVADIYDKYINNKTRNQLSEDEVKKLSAWAGDTYTKLQKLEQTADVINAIDYISKQIINPINRKYGEQIITKPKRKATKSSKAKDKAADGSGKSTAKGPKQGAKGISKTKKTGIVEAVENAKEQIEKHRKEVAVKMEELLPVANLFTLGDINEAIDMAQLSPKDLKASKKQKSKKNPYDDDSFYKDFICKR